MLGHTETTPRPVQDRELDWILRPQRVLLSAAAVLLVLFGSGGLQFGSDFKAVVAVIATANAVWNSSALLGKQWLGDLGKLGDLAVADRLQIAVDLLLALAAVTVVDAQSGALLWILLLVPVIDAGARYGRSGGLAVWAGVSLLYMVVVFRTSPPESVAQDLLQAGIQQSVAVLGVAISVFAVTARVRRRFEELELSRVQAEARRQQLLVVSRASQQMGATQEPAQILSVAAQAAHSLGFDRVDVSEHRGSGWSLLHSVGQPSHSAPDDDAILARAHAQASTLSVGVSHAGRDDLQAISNLGFTRSSSVVARVGDQWSIALRAMQQQATEQDALPVETLEPLVSHTAVALANATSRNELAMWAKQLDYQANHDELTGLPNRAQLSTFLEAAGGEDLAILFLDLDGFKQINDTIGHDAGDRVLQFVAQRLEATVEQDDLAVRLGGDEFVVVARHRDVDRLETLANRILTAMTAPMDVGSQTTTVGASIGVAFGRRSDIGDVQALLARADQAMYQAKQAGRRSGSPVVRFADARIVSEGSPSL